MDKVLIAIIFLTCAITSASAQNRCIRFTQVWDFEANLGGGIYRACKIGTKTNFVAECVGVGTRYRCTAKNVPCWHSGTGKHYPVYVRVHVDPVTQIEQGVSGGSTLGDEGIGDRRVDRRHRI